MEARDHDFVRHPNRTLVTLSLPVMASLVVEPLAGLVDTAFVERLGAAYSSALAAATAIFASVMWIFNFLGVGTQTEVARAEGSRDRERASEVSTLALVLAIALGVVLAMAAWPFLRPAARWMSDERLVQDATTAYLKIRLLGAPFLLVVLSSLGTLRGLQRMRTTLWIAASVSVLNIVLDPILIFGFGPTPRLGIVGAAWATTGSQAAGAVAALIVINRSLGFATVLTWRKALALLVVGRDMIVRTAALLLFLLVATRNALQIGVEAGAAHQAIRQVWMVMAFLLDAFAFSAQSLVSFFIGAYEPGMARRAARVACGWALGTGFALAVALLASTDIVAMFLVPQSAVALFSSAWFACAVAQPLNSISFVTDGIHWGTGDFSYLRNAMLISTAIGVGCLALIDTTSQEALTWVWWVTALWIAMRAAFGVLRIWPGTTKSPLRLTLPPVHL